MRLSSADSVFLEEVDNYTELSYLRKREIVQKINGFNYCKNKIGEILKERSSEQLGSLNWKQNLHIYGRFKAMGDEVSKNLHHRFEKSRILACFPELSFNPFVDRIFHVFSSLKDEKMSFEDVLDLASAFSEECPIDVKARWAFLMFDFDGDQLLNQDDIAELVTRLTKSVEISGHDDSHSLSQYETEQVAKMIFDHIVLFHSEGITCVEFVNEIKKNPEFKCSFRIKFF